MYYVMLADRWLAIRKRTRQKNTLLWSFIFFVVFESIIWNGTKIRWIRVSLIESLTSLASAEGKMIGWSWIYWSLSCMLSLHFSFLLLLPGSLMGLALFSRLKFSCKKCTYLKWDDKAFVRIARLCPSGFSFAYSINLWHGTKKRKNNSFFLEIIRIDVVAWYG